MNQDQVVEVLGVLEAESVRVWVAGGWGVDAIVGHQTRDHGDLDLAADIRDLPRLLEGLGRDGFIVTTDWMPSRIEVRAPDGRAVDIHPVTFAEDGSGEQAGHGAESFTYAPDGFASGRIADHVIPCLSIAQQLRFREGYELREVDVHDMALLERYC